jgi:hypothetical protein
MLPKHGAVGMSVGVTALADSGLMFVVSTLLYAASLPEFDAEDALLFDNELLWVCPCFWPCV